MTKELLSYSDIKNIMSNIMDNNSCCKFEDEDVPFNIDEYIDISLIEGGSADFRKKIKESVFDDSASVKYVVSYNVAYNLADNISNEPFEDLYVFRSNSELDKFINFLKNMTEEDDSVFCYLGDNTDSYTISCKEHYFLINESASYMWDNLADINALKYSADVYSSFKEAVDGSLKLTMPLRDFFEKVDNHFKCMNTDVLEELNEIFKTLSSASLPYSDQDFLSFLDDIYNSNPLVDGLDPSMLSDINCNTKALSQNNIEIKEAFEYCRNLAKNCDDFNLSSAIEDITKQKEKKSLHR